MGFEEAMDAIARGVEVLGIVTLVLGLAAALVRGGLALVGGQGGEKGYRIVRTVFGRSILLGLEFLVAADISAPMSCVDAHSWVRIGAGCPLTPEARDRRRSYISRALGAASGALHCCLEHADQIRIVSLRLLRA